jgi:endonuclease YncB( thermonuclease family)
MRGRIVIVVAAALGMSSIAGVATAQDVTVEAGQPGTSQLLTGRVVNVLDGRTLRVRTDNGRTRTVRLIGVDAPTIRRDGAVECGALAAWDSLWRAGFTRSRDTDGDGLRDAPGGTGKKVAVLTDTSVKSPAKGPLIAYVAPIGTEGSLSVTQVQKGWAKPTAEAAKLSDATVFQQAAQAAQAQDLGVWGGCAGEFHVDGSIVF